MDHDEYMNRMHTEILNVMDQIHLVCEKNDIKYCVMYGSLLGSVRHHGFIPWDDDFDIVMLRDDFNKFISICDKELPDNLRLLWNTKLENYWYPFAKIHNTNTVFVESKYRNAKEKTGIYVDIFPLDYSRISVCNRIRKRIVLFINAIMADKAKGRTGTRSFKQTIRSFVGGILPIKSWRRIQEYLVKRNKPSDLVTNFGSPYYSLENETFPISWFESREIIDFEGKQYYGPSHKEEILEKVYGEYMKLPPVDKRKTHYPSTVVFSDGVVVEFDKD